eukprot:64575-Chlamydomonas_euryale.AAC.2
MAGRAQLPAERRLPLRAAGLRSTAAGQRCGPAAAAPGWETDPTACAPSRGPRPPRPSRPGREG